MSVSKSNPAASSDRTFTPWHEPIGRNDSSRQTLGTDAAVLGVSAADKTQDELSRFTWLGIYISTAFRLGVANIARVAFYRACKRTGIYEWLLPRGEAAPLELDGASFRILNPPKDADQSVLIDANALLEGRAPYFSPHTKEVGNPPNWFLNPFLNIVHPHSARHWSQIPIFNHAVGDIKIFWEMSRFTWAAIFARAWLVSGDTRYLSALHRWIEGWWEKNPPNTGPNWMCGQETSIRLINTLLAIHLVAKDQDYSTLVPFVWAHCKRVHATTFYAVGQDNNHGISEAAGLFVGGSWLARYAQGAPKSYGQKCAKKGRTMLEKLVSRLVLRDGTFAQHSLTYHRLLLDTLSLVEVWRKDFSEGLFSPPFYSRAAAATRWLGAIIDRYVGDGPNLGSNDSAHPYRLDSSDFRDFRPSLQLASRLFTTEPALEPGPWDEPSTWLGVRSEKSPGPWVQDRKDTSFPDGGYVVIRNSTRGCLILRAPTARFRPPHADALHIDLWWNGINLLRDGGTESYADDGVVSRALASAIGHNVAQFDDHDQMPRLGRFLYGSWLRIVSTPAVETDRWSGGYTDAWGAHHCRTVSFVDRRLTVRDRLEGFKRKAVLRWRLAPGDWCQNEVGCTSRMARIEVNSSVPLRSVRLETGWESRFYLQRSVLPVLKVEVDRSPAELTTIIDLR